MPVNKGKESWFKPLPIIVCVAESSLHLRRLLSAAPCFLAAAISLVVSLSVGIMDAVLSLLGRLFLKFLSSTPSKGTGRLGLAMRRREGPMGQVLTLTNVCLIDSRGSAEG